MDGGWGYGSDPDLPEIKECTSFWPRSTTETNRKSPSTAGTASHCLDERLSPQDPCHRLAGGHAGEPISDVAIWMIARRGAFTWYSVEVKRRAAARLNEIKLRHNSSRERYCPKSLGLATAAQSRHHPKAAKQYRIRRGLRDNLDLYIVNVGRERVRAQSLPLKL